MVEIPKNGGNLGRRNKGQEGIPSTIREESTIANIFKYSNSSKEQNKTNKTNVSVV